MPEESHKYWMRYVSVDLSMEREVDTEGDQPSFYKFLVCIPENACNNLFPMESA